MTTTPHQPAMPNQPVFPPQQHWGSDPTTAIPVQRTGSPTPPPAAPRSATPQPATPQPPKGRRRWPFAVGGLVVGLVIGLSAHGGTTAAPAAASAAAPASASAVAPAPAVPAAPALPAAPAVPAAPAAPAAPAGPLTSFSDGTYEVGTDIAAGKYKTPGPGSTDIMDSCYMEVGDGSGSLSGISQNDNLTGPGVVTLKKGTTFKARGGCTWTKVG